MVTPNLPNLRPDPKWLRGQCWDMAVMLHVRSDLPLRGLFDAHGDCHHAFVWDESLQRGIDARGMLTIERLKQGCGGQEVRELSRTDIEKPGGWFGRELANAELNAAWRYAKKMHVLTRWESMSAAQVSDNSDTTTPLMGM